MTSDEERWAEAMEVRLYDHLIIGAGEYTSFRATGLLWELVEPCALRRYWSTGLRRTSDPRSSPRSTSSASVATNITRPRGSGASPTSSTPHGIARRGRTCTRSIR